MQKKSGRLLRAVFLTMALVMLGAFLVGCNATIANPTVMTVGDLNISYNAYKEAYYTCYKAYSGYSMYDVSTSDKLKAFQDIVFDFISEYALTAYYAQQNGVTLSDDDMVQVETALMTDLSSALANYASDAKEALGEDATDDELIAKEMQLMSAVLKSNTGMTYDEYVADLRSTYEMKQLSEKYKETLVADAVVPDGDVESYYDTLVEQDRTLYTESPAQYYTDYMEFIQNGGIRPLVAPEGYCYYKHIYIADPLEGEEKDSEALVAQVLQTLSEGADFEEAIALYNEDTAMETVPYKDEGFMVSEYNRSVYLDEFVDACLALENIGDVSDPVKTATGTHIIKKVGVVSTDPIPMEEVEEALHSELLYLAQLKIYKAKIEEWTASTKITKYYQRVANYLI